MCERLCLSIHHGKKYNIVQQLKSWKGYVWSGMFNACSVILISCTIKDIVSSNISVEILTSKKWRHLYFIEMCNTNIIEHCRFSWTGAHWAAMTWIHSIGESPACRQTVTLDGNINCTSAWEGVTVGVDRSWWYRVGRHEARVPLRTRN